MSEKILIVVDVQNDFVDGVLGSEAAKKAALKVADKIVKWEGNYVIYTLDTHIAPFYGDTVEGQMVPAHCEDHTEGWELNVYVLEALSKFLWTKAYSHMIYEVEKDTFAGFEIEKVINEDIQPTNPFEIEIVGLCTDICVISNALLLRSVFPMANITIDAECCSGTSEANHKAALKVMKANCIEIKNMEVNNEI